MTELSEARQTKEKKFIELFGESEEEDMMQDSPVSIEEHLTDLKEKISTLIVKYFMPF